MYQHNASLIMNSLNILNFIVIATSDSIYSACNAWFDFGGKQDVFFPHFNAEFRFTRARNSYKNYVPSKFNISEPCRPCIDTAEG